MLKQGSSSRARFRQRKVLATVKVKDLGPDRLASLSQNLKAAQSRGPVRRLLKILDRILRSIRCLRQARDPQDDPFHSIR